MDGTGQLGIRADVGVKDGKVTELGRNPGASADRTIDASGRVVSPGFIDVHSHSDLTLLIDPLGHSKLMQGVTTEVNGNCGFGVAPISKESLPGFVEFWKTSGSEWFGVETTWGSFGQYLDLLQSGRPSLNTAVLAAHGTIRFEVMKAAPRKASEDEMVQMERMVEACMQEGACGLSSGLRYVPGCYADVQELARLCTVVRRFGGLYATHMRSEGDNGSWEDSVKEAAEAAKRGGVPLEISHLKALSKNVWNTSGQILKLCESLRKEGLDLTADQYPYDAAHTGLTVFLPTWTPVDSLEGLSIEKRKEVLDHIRGILEVRGGPSRIVMISSPSHRLDGKNIGEAAASLGLSPEETILRLIIESGGEISIISRSMNEDDIRTIMKDSSVMFSTDGYAINPEGPAAVGIPHPRSYGTYPRVLGRYVRGLELISLEDAVRKMTWLPAEKFRLRGRGIVREGAWADIVVFDPATIEDRSTFSSPAEYPAGIDAVLVNGKVTIDKGRVHTGERAGTVLKMRDRVVV